MPSLSRSSVFGSLSHSFDGDRAAHTLSRTDNQDALVLQSHFPRPIVYRKDSSAVESRPDAGAEHLEGVEHPLLGQIEPLHAQHHVGEATRLEFLRARIAPAGSVNR